MDADSKKAQAAAGPVRAPAVARKPQERAFWAALACAAVAHTALVAGFVRSLPQRQMGEKGGMPEGVSVAMVDAADLASRSTFAKEGAAAGPDHGRSRPAPPTQKEAPDPSGGAAAREHAASGKSTQAPELVTTERGGQVKTV